jgi:hypothetical protein
MPRDFTRDQHLLAIVELVVKPFFAHIQGTGH